MDLEYDFSVVVDYDILKSNRESEMNTSSDIVNVVNDGWNCLDLGIFEGSSDNNGDVSEQLVMFSVNEGQGETEEDAESEERIESNTYVVDEGQIYKQLVSDDQVKSNVQLEIDS